ncbi:unnamed protein product, partial [Phaeothamnion confervicola]
MTGQWMDESFVRRVVVRKDALDEKLLPLLTDEPIVLPPWDPMGSLA